MADLCQFLLSDFDSRPTSTVTLGQDKSLLFSTSSSSGGHRRVCPLRNLLSNLAHIHGHRNHDRILDHIYHSDHNLGHIRDRNLCRIYHSHGRIDHILGRSLGHIYRNLGRHILNHQKKISTTQNYLGLLCERGPSMHQVCWGEVPFFWTETA